VLRPALAGLPKSSTPPIVVMHKFELLTKKKVAKKKGNSNNIT